MNDDISRLEAAITELEQQLAQAADPTLQAILRTRIAEKHQALRQHTGQPAAPPSGTSTTIHGGVTGVVLSGTFEGPVNVQTPDDSAWRYTLLRDLAKHYGAPLNDDADAATLDAEDARLAAQIPRLDEVQQHAILIIVRLYSKRRIMGGVWGGRSPSTSRVCEPRAMRHWDAGRRQSAPPPVPVGPTGVSAQL